MNILLSGASGLVGTELKQYLILLGHKCTPLKRLKSNKTSSPNWNFSKITQKNETYFDSVIHLAGENIAAKRWSKLQKQAIYDSRIEGTKKLIQQIIDSPNPPKTFICASAIGYYGNRKNEKLTEQSSAGDQFVSKVCKDWEECTRPLEDIGVRVVNLRFGVILSDRGGALKKMLTPFKMGLGGKLGDGNQHFSWTSLHDSIRAIEFCLSNKSVHGPVNVVSPQVASNESFTEALAESLKRPAFLPMPKWMARLIFGEMANELLLSGQKVHPKKLLEHGFEFHHKDLSSALNFYLG